MDMISSAGTRLSGGTISRLQAGLLTIWKIQRYMGFIQPDTQSANSLRTGWAICRNIPCVMHNNIGNRLINQIQKVSIWGGSSALWMPCVHLVLEIYRESRPRGTLRLLDKEQTKSKWDVKSHVVRDPLGGTGVGSLSYFSSIYM